MNPATLRHVERYWSDMLGVTPGALFRGVSVRAHVGLGDYPGVIIVARSGGCHVSAPEHMAGPIARKVRGAAVGDLVSPVWWRQAMGGGFEVLGPSVHHFLDRADSLPGTAAGPAGAASAEPLRRAVTDGEWREGGFAEEPRTVFIVRSDAGMIVAAANLTAFGSMLADVGVLTHPGHRGHGYGRVAAASATRYSLIHNGLARWRARAGNTPSLAIARRLGFEPWCRQLAVTPCADHRGEGASDPARAHQGAH